VAYQGEREEKNCNPDEKATRPDSKSKEFMNFPEENKEGRAPGRLGDHQQDFTRREKGRDSQYHSPLEK